ncbi:hypothetical protein ANN_05848 [Periplaneta americana]|uniref:C-type lectin domain-containing protein n=1 Tax=Periplaneta americana TaxID=6978 RepID=A0ABQ8TBY5_PERAM|nr:hypothetical protein ANN_05848 [Periplaneta americana]
MAGLCEGGNEPPSSLKASQRITTIQLDGVQYFISRMNPYSPELNYFLAYQYCRSIGLQLASFESREKADSMTQYLLNAGYNGHDYWTSGNRLGADMLIWMSSGVTFNATFDYMRKAPFYEVENSTSGEDATETDPGTSEKPLVVESGRRARRAGRRQSQDRMCGTEGPGTGLGYGRLWAAEGLHLRADAVLLLQLRLYSSLHVPGVSRNLNTCLATYDIKKLEKLSTTTALRLFYIQIAPIVSYALKKIWVHLTSANLKKLEAVKASYLKELQVSRTTQTRLVYLLMDTDFFVRELMTSNGLQPTPAYEAHVRDREEKAADVDQEFLQTPAMNTEEWKKPNFELRHVFTRTAAHGFHHRICAKRGYHSASEQCICTLCGHSCRGLRKLVLLLIRRNLEDQRNHKVKKPTETTATTEHKESATFPTTATTTRTYGGDTPLGPLLNFTVNRRITLRPAAGVVEDSTQSSTPSPADLLNEENPAARAVPDRETDNNVVYVTAIGANSDQQAIEYINMNSGFTADQHANEEGTTKKATDGDNPGIV